MENIEKIQNILRQYHMDGWIFTDFQGRDIITKNFLSLGDRPATRRLFYFIPAYGSPVKVLSAIEPLLLEHLPGEKILYKGKDELCTVLSKILKPKMRLACQYSPYGNVPAVSTMDAGMLEFIRKFGVNPVSSANLLQYFGAVLTPEQVKSHEEAGIYIHRVLEEALRWIRDELDKDMRIDEWQLLQKIKTLIQKTPLVMDEPPFLGVNEHASDPGYEPSEKNSFEIKEGSRLIIDIAGKLDSPQAVYYDVTWCMYVGKTPDKFYSKLFDIVWEARETVRKSLEIGLKQGRFMKGCEADALTKAVFEKYGMEKFIKHRTGHNIGTQCHGTGTNLDDFETHDDRLLLPGTLFSVEPGLYTGEYGVRLEYDIYITPEKKVTILGPVQDKILCI